jgi:hypothetical protein
LAEPGVVVCEPVRDWHEQPGVSCAGIRPIAQLAGEIRMKPARDLLRVRADRTLPDAEAGSDVPAGPEPACPAIAAVAANTAMAAAEILPSGRTSTSMPVPSARRTKKARGMAP